MHMDAYPCTLFKVQQKSLSMGTSYQDIPLLKPFWVKTYLLGNVFRKFTASFITRNAFYIVICPINSHKTFFFLSFSSSDLFHIVFYCYNNMKLHLPKNSQLTANAEYTDESAVCTYPPEKSHIATFAQNTRKERVQVISRADPSFGSETFSMYAASQLSHWNPSYTFSVLPESHIGTQTWPENTDQHLPASNPAPSKALAKGKHLPLPGKQYY